jgi:hypothetical protein
LYGGEVEVMDGTKFRVNNSRKHNDNKTTAENELSRIEKRINEYLARQLDVCYNVQTVVDGTHHLIVDFDIAERSDDKMNLLTMSEKAKEVLEVERFTTLADKGYYDGKDIVACEAAVVTCLVAKLKPGRAKKKKAIPAGILCMTGNTIVIYAPVKPRCGTCAIKHTVTARSTGYTPIMGRAGNARRKTNARKENAVR